MEAANDNMHHHLDRLVLRGKRVLVVEDEALLAMFLEDELVDAGVEVVGAAGSVVEALQLVMQAVSGGGLSAAVLDINLGGTMVYPVADMLAAFNVPFLFTTGYNMDRDMGAHAAAPMLLKPLPAGELIAALEALVSVTEANSSGKKLR